MTLLRVICSVVSGPNEGDAMSLGVSACRLVGRHLSDDETIMLDRDGNRALDRACAQIITAHFSRPDGTDEKPSSAIDVSTFERGPDFILADASISRLHAMMFCDAHGPAVVDLGSANGTYLNGRRVSSSALNHGDVVVIGNSQISIRLTSS